MANIQIWMVKHDPYCTVKDKHRYIDLDIWFGVWPVTFDHYAGVVWTMDRWSKVHKDSATLIGTVINPYGGYDEQWKVTISSGPLLYYPAEFQYALYVTDSHEITYWDNNHGANYKVST